MFPIAFWARSLFAASRSVICVSTAERDLLVQHFPSTHGKVAVIPNGVDVERIRSAAPWDDVRPTVLSLGRLEPYKRVDRLVRAMALVPEPLQLVIIGDGTHRQALESLVDSCGLESRVQFFTGADDVTVARWLRTSCALVSLSEHEAFGVTPLEAGSCGAHVVLSDIPAHREIADRYLPETSSIIGDPDDTSALARAIVAAARKPLGPPADVPLWRDVAALTEKIYEAEGRAAVREAHGGAT